LRDDRGIGGFHDPGTVAPKRDGIQTGLVHGEHRDRRSEQSQNNGETQTPSICSRWQLPGKIKLATAIANIARNTCFSLIHDANTLSPRRTTKISIGAGCAMH
jgi:hypothetical protein